MELGNIVYLIVPILIGIYALKFSKKIIKYILIILAGSFVFLILNGCSKGNLDISNSMEAIEENTLTRIKDMPFVKESKIDISKSLIFGEGKSWSGQLAIKVPSPKPEVFNFYVRNIGEFGWKEQTTIRGETSILNYVGENSRVAIISITELAFDNSLVLISVAPYTEEFEAKVGEFINEKYLEITN
tara:strand:- start:439 stop:999 length:561 start_codon:yes stop_codon:yes gene_type:complete